MPQRTEKEESQYQYNRGYVAGRRKRKQEDTLANRRKADQAFLDKAFLAALPACVDTHGWTSGDQKITSLHDRTELAWKFASKALQLRRYAP